MQIRSPAGRNTRQVRSDLRQSWGSGTIWPSEITIYSISGREFHSDRGQEFRAVRSHVRSAVRLVRRWGEYRAPTLHSAHSLVHLDSGRLFEMKRRMKKASSLINASCRSHVPRLQRDRPWWSTVAGHGTSVRNIIEAGRMNNPSFQCECFLALLTCDAVCELTLKMWILYPGSPIFSLIFVSIYLNLQNLWSSRGESRAEHLRTSEDGRK